MSRVPFDGEPMADRALAGSEEIQARRPSGDRAACRAADLQLFARRYARKAQPGREPNARRYDRGILTKGGSMRPEEIDAMLRFGEED